MDRRAIGDHPWLFLVLSLAATWACGSGPGEPPPEPPRPAQVAKISGDAQTGTVNQALAEAIVVRVNDQFGQPMSGVTVNFAVTAGGGSTAAASAATDAGGQASTTWTMGTTAGNQQLTATASGTSVRATFSATADPDAPSDLLLVSGSNQVAPRNATLQQPLVVRLTDQFGNGLSNVPVEFVVLTGGGTLNPAMVNTNANGRASTSWTLGDPEGEQTVEARVDVLPGVTLQFSAQAVNFSVTSISPDTLVEGAQATIIGEGFDDATPSNNVVTIDGVAATVVAATPTELTVTVPTYDCRPIRMAGVSVGQSGFSLPAINHPVRPTSFLNLAVGEMRLLQTPGEFCFQFPPSASGAEAYIIGVGSAAETPTAQMFSTLRGTAGLAASPGGVTAQMLPQLASTAVGQMPLIDAERLAARRAHLAAELDLRQQDLELIRTRSHALLRGSSRSGVTATAAARAVPVVGDTIRFRVPNINFNANSCTQFTEVTTVVRAVGDAGVFVTDIANPTTGALTDAELQAASDTFDLFTYDVDTLYLGPPQDLDGNERVYIVLTIEVNKLRNGAVAGFVTTADLFARSPSGCLSSDTGEVFYSHVPDPSNTAGTSGRTKAGVLGQMPSLIAHEFAHIIQFERRVIEPPVSNFIPDLWELEGQATLMEEVVGHAIIGNSPGQNIGASQVLDSNHPGFTWYNPSFAQLALYYGWIPPSGHSATAPELCTLFGDPELTTACEPFWFYGASWSFQRYVLDRFGPSQPNGETDLSRGWLVANKDLDGVDNIEALLGVGFDSVFSQWAAMHWADDRIANADPLVQMTSWNLFNIFSSVSAEGTRLVPLERTFTTFSGSRSIRGGSTAYTRLSAAAGHPAFSVSARGAGAALLPAGSRPQFWIVREQ